MELEYKSFGANISAGVQDGTIEAIVAVFNNVDSGGEVIRPGAFTDSLAVKLPKGVWSHRWQEEVPIAKTLEANEVLAGDSFLPSKIRHLGGLYIKGLFNLEIERARDVYSSYKFETLDEFSIGYQVKEDRLDKKDNNRELLKLKLHEWSPVLVGMNDSTTLMSIKSGAPALKLSEHSEAVLATCEEFAVRIKSLRDLRAKEGRSISSTTRGRIQASIDGMTVCIADLTELIAIPEVPIAPPMKAAQEQARHIHAEILRTLSTA